MLGSSSFHKPLDLSNVVRRAFKDDLVPCFNFVICLRMLDRGDQVLDA